MNIIYDINGTSYPIVSTSLERVKRLNGESVISVRVKNDPLNNPWFNKIAKRWYMDVKDERYILTQMFRVGKGTSSELQIIAIRKFFDDMKQNVIYEEWTEQTKLSTWLKRTLNGSGYTSSLVGFTDSSIHIENFGMDTSLVLFNQLQGRYGFEFKFNDITKHIDIYPRVGTDLPDYVRYKTNLQGMELEEISDNFSTYGKGFGAFIKDSKGNDTDQRYVAEWTSPLAKTYGILPIKPVVDERYTSVETLQERVQREVEATLPQPSFTASIGDIEFGEKKPIGERVNVGDSIWMIDNRIGYEERIRIFEVTETFDAKMNVTRVLLTLGNYNDEYLSNSNSSSKDNVLGDLVGSLQNGGKLPTTWLPSADNKNRVFYGVDEPTEAQFGQLKEGDLWYQPFGEYTRLYIYNGVTWEFVMSNEPDDSIINAIEDLETELGNSLEEIADIQDGIVDLGNQISLKVSKGDVLSQINVEAGKVIIGSQSGTDGNYIMITPQTTYIQDATIKNAHIANSAIDTAKIKDASITSAKIISLDASKITANSLSAITTNTGTLNVTGWINLNSDNYGIRASYDYGDKSDGAYNPRWFVGDYTLGYRYQKFITDVYNVTADDKKGSFKYYAETFFGGDYVKLRQYTSKTNVTLKGRIDMTAGRLEINDGWDDSGLTGITLTGDGKAYFEGLLTGAGGVYVGTGSNGKALETGRIDAPSTYGTLWLNSNNSLADIQLGGDNIYFNVQKTTSADFRIGKDGVGKLVHSMAIYNRTYSNASNMFVTNEGSIGRAVSASKYKLLIEPSVKTINHSKNILNIQPKSWFDKAEVESVAKAIEGEEIDKSAQAIRHHGFIAEDFEAQGLEEVVVRNTHGEVEGLAYDRITMYLIPILKEHEERLKELERN